MFILDPVKEADRKARIENEPNIDKKKEINNYGKDAECKEDDAIFMADWKFQDDIKEAKNIINGDYDESIDANYYLD